MKNGKTRVLIASPQILFRQGLELIFSSIEDIEVISTTDINNALALTLDESPPDVAIVDIDNSSDSGLRLARRIKQRLPSIGIVILSSNPNDDQLFQVLKAQAAAYLNKEIDITHLSNAIKRVAAGEHPINKSLTTNPNVADHVLQQFQELFWQSENENFISPLTQKETEILNYITQGYQNKQIAYTLGIGEQTIKNHITSILRKLNANARTEAVVMGLKKGIVSIKS